MNKPIHHVVIVGGGSAGWLTAGLIAAEHATENAETKIKITLIESPDVKPIGVGEGTWPSMRNTINKIGISEHDFIKSCDASLKQGSQFIDWRTGDKNDVYYHPFMNPQGYNQVNLHHAWQSKYSEHDFADVINMQSHICKADLAPKQLSTPAFAAVTNYGYHLNAAKFAELLKEHCTTKLNVCHILDHVSVINNELNGDIASVSCKKHGEIAGDLFVDCTGSASLLLGKHYNIKLISQKHILFNDSALAVQVPYPNATDDIASATLSTAQSAGWIWDIGLPSRRGIGYTYASDYISDDEAHQQLVRYLSDSIGASEAQKVSARKISFTPGYREKFWHRNCVAIGMSSGFLEPLEASALAMIELGATMIAEQFPSNREQMSILSERYNQRFIYRWQRVIEFLKLHYVLSQRTDSPYWIDNKDKNTIPSRLQDLLSLWQYQPPSRYDFIENEEVFPSASYQYVLYGMKFHTQSEQTVKSEKEQRLADQFFSTNIQHVHKFKAALPSNRALYRHIANNKLPVNFSR